MSARAIYKATIELGAHAVPIKFYSAVQDRGIHFRLLHAKDKVPVKQRMVDPDTGATIESSEIERGVRADDGSLVLLRKDELQELEPPATRLIEILRVLDPQVINHQWYRRPYYLGPDGDEEAYFALAAALAVEGKEALVRWTMRKHDYRGALRSEGGYLVLIALRHAGEVIDANRLPAPSGRQLDPKEKQMAAQLVELLEGPFEPQNYTDEYRERVLELVEQKAKGKKPKLAHVISKKPKEASLSQVLNQSLKAAKEKKVA